MVIVGVESLRDFDSAVGAGIEIVVDTFAVKANDFLL